MQITHETIKQGFTCGDDDLDEFYRNDAILYQEHLLANTYIFYATPKNTVISFISLSNDTISSENESVSNNAFKKIKKKFHDRKYFSSYPAIKIGRFAVATEYKGQGVGKSIIDFIFLFVLKNKENSGACRFVTVDAYEKSIGFYKKCGFNALSNGTKRGTLPMYYDLKQFKNAMNGY